jgi:hypothetical protein
VPVVYLLLADELPAAKTILLPGYKSKAFPPTSWGERFIILRKLNLIF